MKINLKEEIEPEGRNLKLEFHLQMKSLISKMTLIGIMERHQPLENVSDVDSSDETSGTPTLGIRVYKKCLSE